jgi:hypothetical protein
MKMSKIRDFIEIEKFKMGELSPQSWRGFPREGTQEVT